MGYLFLENRFVGSWVWERGSEREVSTVRCLVCDTKVSGPDIVHVRVLTYKARLESDKGGWDATGVSKMTPPEMRLESISGHSVTGSETWVSRFDHVDGGRFNRCGGWPTLELRSHRPAHTSQPTRLFPARNLTYSFEVLVTM